MRQGKKYLDIACAPGIMWFGPMPLRTSLLMRSYRAKGKDFELQFRDVDKLDPFILFDDFHLSLLLNKSMSNRFFVLLLSIRIRFNPINRYNFSRWKFMRYVVHSDSYNVIYQRNLCLNIENIYFSF